MPLATNQPANELQSYTRLQLSVLKTLGQGVHIQIEHIERKVRVGDVCTEQTHDGSVRPEIFHPRAIRVSQQKSEVKVRKEANTRHGRAEQIQTQLL